MSEHKPTQHTTPPTKGDNARTNPDLGGKPAPLNENVRLPSLEDPPPPPNKDSGRFSLTDMFSADNKSLDSTSLLGIGKEKAKEKNELDLINKVKQIQNEQRKFLRSAIDRDQKQRWQFWLTLFLAVVALLLSVFNFLKDIILLN